MPAKKKEKVVNAKRLGVLKEDIDHMLLEGHINKVAHKDMIEILVEKMGKPKTDHLGFSPFRIRLSSWMWLCREPLSLIKKSILLPSLHCLVHRQNCPLLR